MNGPIPIYPRPGIAPRPSSAECFGRRRSSPLHTNSPVNAVRPLTPLTLSVATANHHSDIIVPTRTTRGMPIILLLLLVSVSLHVLNFMRHHSPTCDHSCSDTTTLWSYLLHGPKDRRRSGGRRRNAISVPRWLNLIPAATVTDSPRRELEAPPMLSDLPPALLFRLRAIKALLPAAVVVTAGINSTASLPERYTWGEGGLEPDGLHARSQLYLPEGAGAVLRHHPTPGKGSRRHRSTKTVVPPETWQSLDYECAPPYDLPLPTFLDEKDRSTWTKLERPYDGCTVGAKGKTCHFKGGCSSYHAVLHSYLRRDKMGECRNHPYLETGRTEMSASEEITCDPRILLPLDVPEGLYFGQLHNMLQRLLRLWFREHSRSLWLGGNRTGQPPQPRFLLYTKDGSFRSRDTTEVLNRMGVDVTTEFPQQCFERILWGCHIVNFDPTTPKLMSRLMRQLFDPNATQLFRSVAPSPLGGYPTLPVTPAPPVAMPYMNEVQQHRRRLLSTLFGNGYYFDRQSQQDIDAPQRYHHHHHHHHQHHQHHHHEHQQQDEQSALHGFANPNPYMFDGNPRGAYTTAAPTPTFDSHSDKHINCTHVYASRLNSDAKNGRRMPNEAKLIEHLRTKHHFCILDGRESLQTWANALRHAKVLLGAHGGAMMHTYWLDPKNDPVVIELDGYRKYAIFWLHAASAGFRYAWMSFDTYTGVDLHRVDGLLRTLSASRAQRPTVLLQHPPPPSLALRSA